MQFQILRLVLWPRVGDFPPHTISFTPGTLNVISGVSRTGKSAVIPIIDYCLGSEKCTIPVKTIRIACSWFGILVLTAEGEKLFARKEPGEQRATGEMLLLEAPSIEIPDRIENGNTNAEAVKRRLDSLAGLTSLDFDEEATGLPWRGRPSFRDMMSFVFQPQNIIANQGVLFYKADTFEQREKLRTIFPYALGAVDAEILAKQHEAAQLRRELNRKERELGVLQQVSARWIAEIRGWADEARELGLLNVRPETLASTPDIVRALRQLVDSTDREVGISTATIGAAIEELTALQTEETRVASALHKLRNRYADMSRLKATASEYGSALEVQHDRLALSTWLRALHDPHQMCPICGSGMTDTRRLDSLVESVAAIENETRGLAGVPAAFDRELERVRRELRDTTESLEAIRHRMAVLTQTSEEAHTKHATMLAAARFVGRVEQALEQFERLGGDATLDAEIHELRDRLSQLARDVDAQRVTARIERALRVVSASAQELMPRLDSERPNDPLSLSIDELTVRVIDRNREDYLWEIGSASNWLSYHLAATLALQTFFLSLKASPVPSFLVFDQPSQAYFPRQLADITPSEALDVGRNEASAEPRFTDEDVVAVRKAFEVIASVTAKAAGRLQTIVLDHATDTVWAGVRPLHLVAEWRGGPKLVPAQWVEAAMRDQL